MGKLIKTSSKTETTLKENKTKRRSLRTCAGTIESAKNRKDVHGVLLINPVKTSDKLTPEFKKNLSIKIGTSNKLEKLEISPKYAAEINKLNLDGDSVKSGIQALFKIIQKNKTEKKLFEDDIPIFLQVVSVKVPKCPVRTLRPCLTHSLLKDTSEICLIASDIPNNIRKDHDKAIEHYENLLQSKNVTIIKSIMPYHQFKTEYDQFELKRKLVELYDVFLVEAKISKRVMHKLGKIFKSKRKLPIPIKLHVPKLKEHIDNALKKTVLNIHPNGDNYIVQIGDTNMEENKIFDNVLAICDEIESNFPGGWDNVRAINIKTSTSMSIPVYLSLKKVSNVKVPVVTSNRPKKFKIVTGELSTRFNANVIVHPSGKITIIDKRQNSSKSNVYESDSDSEEIPAEDIVEKNDNDNDRIGKLRRNKKKKQNNICRKVGVANPDTQTLKNKSLKDSSAGRYVKLSRANLQDGEEHEKQRKNRKRKAGKNQMVQGE